MVRLKRRRRCSRRFTAGLFLLIALVLVLPWRAPAWADSEPVPLQLEVKVNGYPLNLVAAFAQLADGKIASPRSELKELGIAAPGEGPDEELVALDSCPGLSYVYDGTNQSIELEVPNASRIAKDFDGSSQGDFEVASSSTGLVVNYSAYAAASYNIEDAAAGLNGGSLSLDARAFSNFGTLQQTGIIGTTTFADMTALRLDTVWSYSDQQRMLTYKLGDIVSGGLNWTRPIRLGGGQVRRNFGLRPDLITRPLPQVAGTAAVPSTLDVYVDGVKAYSSQVQEGPFRVDNIPVFTSAGTARVVLTDSTGRETSQEGEFFTSPQLLKKDLYDFSVEGGAVRLDYSSESFGYGDEPVMLGSMRYGISDILNGEAHAEVSQDLAMGGAGLVFSAGRFGMFAASGAASLADGTSGFLVFGSWEGHIGDFGVSASTTRTFGGFADLAAETAVPVAGKSAAGFPRALDQLSINYNLRQWKAGVGLSFIHRLTSDGERSLLLSAGYSQSLPYDISLFASAYADLGDGGDYGATLGLSMPLGASTNGSVTANDSKSQYSLIADVTKPFDDQPNATAWRVSHSEGSNRTTSANGALRTSKAELSGNIFQQDNMARGNAAVDGAVVIADGGLLLGPKIYDSFAVVDAGAEGVSIQHENRPAGKTGRNGKLLLSNLQAYQKNKIAINVDDLPLNAEVPETEIMVTPRELSGVVVNFGIKKDQTAALVILTDGQGKFIPESAEVVLDGTSEPFLSGYDGQVYITGVGARNSISVKYGSNHCQVSFPFDGNPEAQATIGPLKCV